MDYLHFIVDFRGLFHHIQANENISCKKLRQELAHSFQLPVDDVLLLNASTKFPTSMWTKLKSLDWHKDTVLTLALATGLHDKMPKIKEPKYLTFETQKQFSRPCVIQADALQPFTSRWWRGKTVQVVSVSTEPDMITLDDDLEERAEMPCGHVIGRDSMKQYVDSELEHGRHRIVCPYPGCTKLWLWQTVCHVAPMTGNQQVRLQRRLARSYLLNELGAKICPKCKAYIIRKGNVGKVSCMSCCTEKRRLEQSIKIHKNGLSDMYCWPCFKQLKNQENCLVCYDSESTDELASLYYRSMDPLPAYIQQGGCKADLNRKRDVPNLKCKSCYDARLKVLQQEDVICWRCLGSVSRVGDCDACARVDPRIQYIKDGGYIARVYFNGDVPCMRACPKCGILIDYVAGCAHMSCIKCNHEFCIKCLGKWTSHSGHQKCRIIGVQTSKTLPYSKKLSEQITNPTRNVKEIVARESVTENQVNPPRKADMEVEERDVSHTLGEEKPPVPMPQPPMPQPPASPTDERAKVTQELVKPMSPDDIKLFTNMMHKGYLEGWNFANHVMYNIRSTEDDDVYSRDLKAYTALHVDMATERHQRMVEQMGGSGVLELNKPTTSSTPEVGLTAEKITRLSDVDLQVKADVWSVTRDVSIVYTSYRRTDTNW